MKQNIIYDIHQLPTSYDPELYYNIVDQVLNIIHNFSAPKGTETDVSFIMNNLWLGNWKSAHSANFVNSNKICKIINVTDNIPNKFVHIKYQTFEMRDENACQKNLFGMMIEGAKIINKAINKNKAILIHCKRGHHRSASIIVLYFMMYHNMSLIDALIYVKQIRPTSFRRISCMLNQLIIYEHRRIIGNFM